MDYHEQSENWVAIKGYEGLYEVSDLGNVRSLISNKLLKQSLTGPEEETWPRLKVRLYKNKKGTQFKVHQLVARHFISHTDDRFVLHRNGDRMNNKVTNLYFGTSSDNTKDAITHGTNANKNKNDCPLGHALVGNNLVEAELKRRGGGHRMCRSCTNAKKYVQYHSLEEGALPEVAAQYFEKYMKKEVSL